jgi:hypothetical protein
MYLRFGIRINNPALSRRRQARVTRERDITAKVQCLAYSEVTEERYVLCQSRLGLSRVQQPAESSADRTASDTGGGEPTKFACPNKQLSDAIEQELDPEHHVNELLAVASQGRRGTQCFYMLHIRIKPRPIPQYRRSASFPKRLNLQSVDTRLSLLQTSLLSTPPPVTP